MLINTGYFVKCCCCFAFCNISIKICNGRQTLIYSFSFFILFTCSKSEEDLQNDCRGQRWWGEDESFRAHSGNDHLCSVCQWWMWLRHGLWAWNRSVLLWLTCKINTHIQPILQQMFKPKYLNLLYLKKCIFMLLYI